MIPHYGGPYESNASPRRRSREVGWRVEGQSVKVTDNSFSIDTGRDKTFYYEVAFAEQSGTPRRNLTDAAYSGR